MGPTSPQHLATSPNQFNHFAPLSPDGGISSLDADPEMNAILGLVPTRQRAYDSDETDDEPAPPPRRHSGPLISYTRDQILRLCKRAAAPRRMAPLETWFSNAPGKAAPVDDPAIASMSGPRRGHGGFGEGFGFGGGIGGGRAPGLGRGTRNIGLRRQPGGNEQVDPAIAEARKESFSGPMGKFQVRAPGERNMRLGGDETRHQGGQGGERRRRDDSDWRRGERTQPQRNGEGARRNHGPRYDDESSEPAWMNDALEAPPMEDPAIAGASSSGDPSDPLIKFVPGEDLIAVHKRQMKARAGGGATQDTWRAPEKPLVSFFGGCSAPEQASPVKPREVNVQSYFKHRVVDDEPQKEEDDVPSNTFQSRFQRFFGSTAPGAPPAVSPAERPASSSRVPAPEVQLPQQPPQPQQQAPQAPRVDDHMAKLMGLLSTKGPSPAPMPAPVDMPAPRQPRHEPRPSADMRSSMDLRSPTDMRSQSEMRSPTDMRSPADMRPDGRPDMRNDMRNDMRPPPFHGFPPAPPGISPYQPQETNDYMSARRDQRAEHSPERMLPPHHYSSPPQHGGPSPDPRFGYGYRPPMGELPAHPSAHSSRQYFDGPERGPGGPGGPPPDLLQLLRGAPPRQGPPMPPPMGMLPPHPMYGGPHGPGPSPDDLLRNLQAQAGSPSPGAPPGYLPMRNGGPPPPSGYGPPPMQGFLPPPQAFYGGPGGPGPHQGPGGPGGPGPAQRMPPPGMYHNHNHNHNPHQQQDMLAALLAPRAQQ